MSLLGKALGAGLKHFTGLSITKKQKRSVQTTAPGGGEGQYCPKGSRCDGISTDGLCVGACVPMGGQFSDARGPTGACAVGYRLNKSTYVTRGGGTSHWPQQLIVHPKHSSCVKRRRRNVGNAKALRRAISRVKGFVKLARKAHSLVGGGHRGRKQIPAGRGVEVIRAG